MRSLFESLVRSSIICCLVFTIASAAPLQAQSSIVQPSELRNALRNEAETRQKNLDQVKTFFESEPVRKALSATPMDSSRIQRAVSTLSPDELAQLAARTQKIQSDFAAGSLTNEQLTYIVIAIGTALIVLLLVKA